MKIRTKDKKLVPLELNSVQERYLARVEAAGSRRNWIVKARQFGFTTLTAARYFYDTITEPGTFSVMVADDKDATKQIFQIVKRYLEHLPPEIRPRTKYSNRLELSFPDLDSWFVVGTAGSVTVGRGLTINNLHCSELSRWPKPAEVFAGLLEAVPAGGDVTVESTPNGMGDFFHQNYEAACRGESEFLAHFYPWFLHGEYATEPPGALQLTDEERRVADYARANFGIELTPAQLHWRRQKKTTQRDRYAAEYPDNDTDCFLASGRPRFDREALKALLAQCRPAGGILRNGELAIWKPPEAGQVYVIGADPAEGTVDGDRCAAYVVNWKTNEHVARLWGRWAPGVFAEQLAAVGRQYHGALIAVERNNHGHAVLVALREVHHYPRLYRHHDEAAIAAKLEPRYGWPSNTQTKPVAVGRLDLALSAGTLALWDRDFVVEALGYVYHDTGETGAQTGMHDDLVAAAYVAQEARAYWRPQAELAPASITLGYGRNDGPHARTALTKRVAQQREEQRRNGR